MRAIVAAAAIITFFVMYTAATSRADATHSEPQLVHTFSNNQFGGFSSEASFVLDEVSRGETEGSAFLHEATPDGILETSPATTRATEPTVSTTTDRMRDTGGGTTGGAETTSPADILPTSHATGLMTALVEETNVYDHSHTGRTAWMTSAISETTATETVQEGVVSEDLLNRFAFAAEVGTLVISSIAIPMNVINLLVFSRKDMRTSTTVYVLFISGADLLRSSQAVVTSLHYLIKGGSFAFLAFSMYFGIYFSTALWRSSLCLTALMAAERFVAVTFPLKSRHFRLVRNPVAVCITILVLSFVCHAYVPFKYVVTGQAGGDEGFLQPSWLLQHFPTVLAGLAEFTKVVGVYLPLATVLLLNVATSVMLRRHRHALAHVTSNSQRSDRQITVTVVVSSLLYCLLELPMNVNYSVGDLHPHYGMRKPQENLFQLLRFVFSFLERASDGTNFVVFLIMSSRFKASLRSVFKYGDKRSNLAVTTRSRGKQDPAPAAPAGVM